MPGFLTADQGIAAAKSETTYGTDAFSGGAPSSADVLAMSALDIVQVQEQIEGDRLTATIAGECHAIHLSHIDLSWSMPLIGSSAPGELPPGDPWLRAAGYAATVVADTSVTYTPTIEQQTSLTALLYERSVQDGSARRLMARGVRTNATITLTVGQEAMCEGAGQGLYDPYPAETSALPTLPTAYSGDQCGWVVNRLVLTVDSVVYPVEAMTLETRWTLEVIRAGAASGGGSASQILLVKPRAGARFGGSFTLVDGTAALTAAINAWQTGAKLSLTAVLTKGARTITIAAAAIQLSAPAKTLPRFAVPWDAIRADGTSGVGHLTIAYT